MHRRELLKYLLTTPLATVIDYEKLLWIPGQQIVVPQLTASQIWAAEMARMYPRLQSLFERDAVFFSQIQNIDKKKYTIIGGTGSMKMPLILRPGDIQK